MTAKDTAAESCKRFQYLIETKDITPEDVVDIAIGFLLNAGKDILAFGADGELADVYFHTMTQLTGGKNEAYTKSAASVNAAAMWLATLKANGVKWQWRPTA